MGKGSVQHIFNLYFLIFCFHQSFGCARSSSRLVYLFSRTSANKDNPDSSCDLPLITSYLFRRTVSLGMDLRPSRYSPRPPFNEPSQHSSSMSTVTLRTCSALPSPRHLLWDDTQSLRLSLRPRSASDRAEKIELPSIRQVCTLTVLNERTLTYDRQSQKSNST